MASMISQDLLISICRFLSEILGPSSEVLLHDAQSGSILWINEKALSHRREGEVTTTSILSLLDSRCKKENTDRLVGGLNRSEANTLLRTSNLMIRENDKLRYVICVNQDVTGFSNIQGILDHMLSTSSTPVETKHEESTDIEDIMTKIILEEVKHLDVYQFEGKQAKLDVISRLESRGVFKVKQAFPKVCDLLDIAPPTLYKYLQQVERQEDK
jgi:predicted transcriptional regulator YheO